MRQAPLACGRSPRDTPCDHSAVMTTAFTAMSLISIGGIAAVRRSTADP